MASQGETTAAGDSKRYVKLSVFFNTKSDLTDEEFHKYWSEEHGPLFSSLPIVKEKLVKYNQFHNSMAMREKAVSLGLPVMEFDAAAEFWGADLDSVMSVFQDPGYLEKVVPDENKFITREGSKFMFGYEDLKLDRT